MTDELIPVDYRRDPTDALTPLSVTSWPEWLAHLVALVLVIVALIP